MITFRPMLPEEFPAYLDYFIADYADEIAENYAMSSAAARIRAEREVAAELPAGPRTAGQELLCIFSEQNPAQPIGYLWYRSDSDRHSAFVCDFCILPEYRGQGRGHSSLAALEAMMRQQGYTEIKLRVAADNARAQHLYAVGGFRVTGVNMSKRIDAEAVPEKALANEPTI
ncbi:GNAT family N-acetyltransferase [Rhizobium tumorigenes]|uniref:GNAT family N-acetyltransferase n=1 Tax=Rhizobium tumorigenes TaxID=2041385 RepID=A0AAF1K8I9_9HYPH|nr:GNAT family N-acetyltransferase [Rhizobium tumorigenes]WFR94761.1 GNAT family N-acetyltransferase [Rhizobium tumorigenes]